MPFCVAFVRLPQTISFPNSALLTRHVCAFVSDHSCCWISFFIQALDEHFHITRHVCALVSNHSCCWISFFFQALDEHFHITRCACPFVSDHSCCWISFFIQALDEHFISRIVFVCLSQTISFPNSSLLTCHVCAFVLDHSCCLMLDEHFIFFLLCPFASRLSVCLRPFHFLIAPLQLDFHFSSKYPFRLRVLCIPVSVFWVFYFKHINSKIT